MVSPTFSSLEPVVPTDADRELAAASLGLLTQQAADHKQAIRLQVVDRDGGSQPVLIPASASRLLVAILAEIASGNAVHLVPQDADLTTQEAAEFLGVSRPYMVRLLDEGGIPHRKVGSHRRIPLKDLIAYRAENRRERSAALDELTRLSQELGLY